MTKIPVRLKKILKEQYGFLRRSCDAYDKGSHSEAKRIAVTLRVLVHQTARSNSLFSQLETITGDQVEILSRNAGFSPGLVFYAGITIKTSKDGAEYVPMIDLSHPGLKKITINDWWSQRVLLIAGVAFRRKDVVLSLANKEGGAHVDPVQNEDFRRLTHGDLMLFRDNNGYGIDGVEHVMMRENAFYMIKCIEDNFNDIIS